MIPALDRIRAFDYSPTQSKERSIDVDSAATGRSWQSARRSLPSWTHEVKAESTAAPQCLSDVRPGYLHRVVGRDAHEDVVRVHFDHLAS